VRAWWKANTVRGLVLRTKTGVACPVCGAKFIILQMRVVFVGATILLVGAISTGFALVGLSRILRHDLTNAQIVLAGLPLIALASVAHFRISPLFAQVRLAASNEAADFPLSRHRHVSGI
jgi:hypothetical protein